MKARRRGGRLALAVAGFFVAAASGSAEAPGASADPEAAFASSTRHLRAAEEARAVGDAAAELGHRMRQAESLQGQGRYVDAEAALGRALELARAMDDPRPAPAGLGALGNVHTALRQDALAERELGQAIGMARESGDASLEASLGNNLGNLLAMEAGLDPERGARAATAYAAARAAAERAGDRALETRILGNEARLALERGDARDARQRLDVAVARAAGLPASADNVLTRIHLGTTRVRLFEAGEDVDRERLLATHEMLVRAHTDALALGDLRGSAWAQGTLAALYAHREHLEEALALTRRAVFDAQRASAVDAELRFQLESARLLARLGRPDEAIEAYRIAVLQLAEIRPALGVAYSRSAGSLREEASRGYREMADLLLARAAAGGPGAAADLELTQQLMERFKADELRDYFQDDCVDAYQERITGAGGVGGAVVLYPVLLPDRIELLVTRDGQLRQYRLPVPYEELAARVRTLRGLLEKRVTRQYLPHAQQVYDWLVRPVEAELAASPGATLVFVPDGILRIVPVAALHDGERFLVERHPVATTPGLELSDPRPIDRSDPSMLLAGLSEAVQGYAALPQVREEVEVIAGLFPNDLLLDDDFVETKVDERIRARDYGLVHLASHGQLGARVEDSFVVTHDGRIDLQELSSFLTSTRYREKPVELITLSACDTAAGDERAALGLSGLAVRAGARSALGSLWLVNDEAASQLMIAFYRELAKPGLSRAAALQHAQQQLISDRRWRHPAYWAPFLLISNWL